MRARLALGVGSALLALLLLEAALRALDRPQADACRIAPEWAVADPQLGYRGDPGRPVAGVRPNALGLRGPRVAVPKPAGERRILFLGDSTAWGLGVSLDETFAARATRALDDRLPATRERFVLGAFPGYSSYQSAVLLERLLPLGPDLVVFYVGARNDGDRARYYRDARIPARQARVDAAWHRWHVLRALELGLDRLLRLARRTLPDAARARVPPGAFRANLDRMAAALEQAGVPALVVLPAVSPGFEREQPLVRRYREALERFAADRGLPVVSLDERFEAAARAGENDLFFPDGYHLAARGHARVADAIAAAVEREGLLARTP